jgi:hypothetical protein
LPWAKQIQETTPSMHSPPALQQPPTGSGTLSPINSKDRMPGATPQVLLGQSASIAQAWFARAPATHILRKLLVTLAAGKQVGKPGH